MYSLLEEENWFKTRNELWLPLQTKKLRFEGLWEKVDVCVCVVANARVTEYSESQLLGVGIFQDFEKISDQRFGKILSGKLL